MIKQNTTQKVPKRCFSLGEQVSLDLAKYLDSFPNKSFAVRVLAKETGVNARTIKRLLQKENQPSIPTLFKLYSAFTGEEIGEKLLLVCPDVIRKEFEKYGPCKLENTKYKKVNFLELIEQDPLMGELFVLAGTGPLYKDAVCFRYGQYGVELLEKLEQLNLLKKTDKDRYEMGSNCPTFDGEIIKNLGLRFTQKFCRPSDAGVRGQNVMNFYAEGLNDEGLNEWLAIEEEAYYKKIKVANDPKFRGSKPVFSFSVIDCVNGEQQ
jgi:transcriptional regulator with XRE-family HTH domain